MKPRSRTRCGTSSRTSRRRSRTSDEPWRDDEHPPFGESPADEAAGEGAGFREADDDSFEAGEEERHPLLQTAMDLLVRFGFAFS